jgi:hypothetical protein
MILELLGLLLRIGFTVVLGIVVSVVRPLPIILGRLEPPAPNVGI